MTQLSSIVTSEAELQEYYAELRSQHVKPAWIGAHQTDKPTTKVVPYVWHWRDLRPQVMRAAQLIGTDQAERRVLRMTNPGLEESASNTLVANFQIVMPGEIARAHRHSASALRFIVEGDGGSTIVNGVRIPMYPGDLVLTPNWTWHDHINDTAEPMIWLDGLDTPLVRMLEAGFYEQFGQDSQQVGPNDDPSLMNAGYGGLRPSWEPASSPRYSPLWHYPLSQAVAALERLSAETQGSPFDGAILEYTSPLTGGSVMPTIGCYIQRCVLVSTREPTDTSAAPTTTSSRAPGIRSSATSAWSGTTKMSSRCLPGPPTSTSTTAIVLLICSASPTRPP